MSTLYTKLDPNPIDDRRKVRNWQVTYRLLRNLVSIDGTVTPSFSTRTITADGDLAATDTVALVDASGGAVTIGLPGAAGAAGRIYEIKKTDSSINRVTIDPNSTETIDGELTIQLVYQHACITIVSDGTNWRIL